MAAICKTYDTTNGKLAEVLSALDQLIEWADADAQSSRECDAPSTARDDFRRGTNLRKARLLVKECKR